MVPTGPELEPTPELLLCLAVKERFWVKVSPKHGPQGRWLRKAPSPQASVPTAPGSSQAQRPVEPAQGGWEDQEMTADSPSRGSAGNGRWSSGSGDKTGPLTSNRVGEGSLPQCSVPWADMVPDPGS